MNIYFKFAIQLHYLKYALSDKNSVLFSAYYRIIKNVLNQKVDDSAFDMSRSTTDVYLHAHRSSDNSPSCNNRPHILFPLAKHISLGRVNTVYHTVYAYVGYTDCASMFHDQWISNSVWLR